MNKTNVNKLIKEKENGKIYFLSSDRNGRILGIKQNWEEVPTILRYRIEIINEK